MSSNFEHLLFGKEMMNASMKEKISLCKEYNVSCKANVHLPRETILNEKYIASDYDESWKEIELGKKSLSRKTNINLFLNAIM